MPTKYLLREDQIPRHWYNILADLAAPPAPVLHPQTRKPVGPQDLAPLFPMAIIEQEMSTRREVPIPDEVRDARRHRRRDAHREDAHPRARLHAPRDPCRRAAGSWR